MIEKDISKFTKTELDTYQQEIQKEYREALDRLSTVEVAEHEIGTKIHDLQSEKRKMAVSVIQGKAIVRRCASMIASIKLETWKKLSEGEI
jgi:hypothetical protein